MVKQQVYALYKLVHDGGIVGVRAMVNNYNTTRLVDIDFETLRRVLKQMVLTFLDEEELIEYEGSLVTQKEISEKLNITDESDNYDLVIELAESLHEDYMAYINRGFYPLKKMTYYNEVESKEWGDDVYYYYLTRELDEDKAKKEGKAVISEVYNLGEDEFMWFGIEHL